MESNYFRLKSMKLKKFQEKLYLHRIVGKKMTFVYGKFEKGKQEIGIKHHSEEFFYVVKGHLKAEVGENSYILRDGDVILIPSNEVHSFVALKNSTVLCVFAPPITEKKAKAIMKKIKS